ncbi:MULTISPECIES: hypothetical protein [unclassified Calothrix]|uniref:hypothetical protein n=1 Tax=unclassified Calothrix TaxID=2619626 RepID=UPI0030DBDCAB
MKEDKQKILQLLAELIEANPDQRFCQLLYNLTYHLQKGYISNDIFYIEDKDLIEALNEKLNDTNR